MSADIVIMAAVSEEVAFLVNRLEDPVCHDVGGRKITHGFLEGQPLRILVSGPGLINTAQALTAMVEHARPGMVVQTGCAGAFRETGLAVGDIAVADGEIDAHLGIEPRDRCWPLEELPFSVISFQGTGIRNRYPTDHPRVKAAVNVLQAVLAEQGVHMVKGPFLTVATITATEERARRLYGAYGACMEQMEGSAAAHVCLHYDIPFLELRAASNIVGRRDLSQWNIPLACERAGKALLHLLPILGSDSTFLQERW